MTGKENSQEITIKKTLAPFLLTRKPRAQYLFMKNQFIQGEIPLPYFWGRTLRHPIAMSVSKSGKKVF